MGLKEYFRFDIKKMIKEYFFIILIFIMFISIGYNMGRYNNSQNNIPVSDIAEMYINDDGYYTIVIKDVTYVDDKSYNASYGEIMDSIK